MFTTCPADRYFRYLVTHPRGYDNEAIIAAAAKHGRYCPGPDYLDALRDELTPPRPFRPRSKKHKASQRFLIEHEIDGFYDGSEETKRAWEIVKNPRLCETVEVNLIVGAPWKSSVFALRTRYAFECTEAAIQRFSRMFYDALLVSVTDLRAITFQQAKQRQERTGMPPYMDPRVIASRLPRAGFSVILASLKMGVPIPKNTDHAKLLRSARDAAALRMLEESLVGAPGASRRAADWATTVRITSEILEASTEPETELREALRSIELVTEPIKTPTIAELTDGNFSDGSFIEPN